MSVYPFIEAEKACRRNVSRACELLKVSRAAFYQHLRGNRSRRDREDAGLAGQIRAVHQESKGRYGAPRIHAELARRGYRHGVEPPTFRFQEPALPQVIPPAQATRAIHVRRRCIRTVA